MDFPETISYGDLAITHPDYNPDQVLDRYEALYAGGKLFRQNLEKFEFLDKRQLDGSSAAHPRSNVMEPQAQFDTSKQFHGMSSRWDEKKRTSRYTNYIAGMLDYFVQGVFKDDPSIIGKGDYWTKLNDNADGTGRNLSTVSRTGMLDTLKFNRTFLSISVPEVAAATLAQQRTAGGLDPRINILCACDVNMWDYSGKNLQWVRTYRKDLVRTKVFGNSDMTRELWTYITEHELIEYETTYPNEKKPEPGTLIPRKAKKVHGFNRIPIIPIQICADLWAMQRLEDPALALYNRESAKTSLLNSAAFQILTLATDVTRDQVPDVGIGALWVGLQGSANFVGPEGVAFDAQFKDCELLKSNLYEVFQALGINALAVQDQNARQSARAKGMDKEPLYALLVTFGAAMRAALSQAGKLISEFRGETAPVVDGLQDFDVLSLKEKLENLLTAQGITGFSETARRKMLENAALAATPGADNAVRNKIITESTAADLTVITPPPGGTTNVQAANNPPQGKGDVANG